MNIGDGFKIIFHEIPHKIVASKRGEIENRIFGKSFAWSYSMLLYNEKNEFQPRYN